MSRNITPVSNTDNFEDWIAATNSAIAVLLDTVTVVATANGDITSGNGFVVGTFGANTVTASTIRGGNVTSSGVLTFGSNVVFDSQLITIDESTINAISNSVSVFSNSTIKALEIVNDGTSTVTAVAGNTLNVSANLNVQGSIMKIPSGTTATRPSGSNGMIRYNTNNSVMEYYANSGWVSILSSASGNVIANSVTFEPNANVTSNNVQLAIHEVFTKKVTKTGDTMTGNLVINSSGATVVAAPSGTILHVAGADSVSSSVTLDAVAAVPKFVGRRSQGTNASRTKVLNGTVLVSLSGSGHNGTGVVEDKASIDLVASQDWFTANNGTQLLVKTTPNSSNSSVNTMMVSVSSSYVNTASLTVTGNLTVGGEIVSNGNITAFSDRRLKDDIRTIEDALDKVRKLRGVTYTRDGIPGQGVIAQEVAEVIPEVVTQGEVYLSVAYGNLIGVLIESIKELSDKVDEMEKTIDDLRG